MSRQSPPKPRLSTAHLPVPSAISPVSSTDGNVSPLLPPFVPRPSMSRHSTANSAAHPHSRSNGLTSQSPATVAARHAFRLLMPTVRPTRPLNTSPASRTSSAKLSPAKHSRSRAGSLAPSSQPSPDPSFLASVSIDWIGDGRRFEVVEDQLEVEGFQLYAVEKW